MNLPSYDVSICISHNDHKCSYISVEEYLHFCGAETDDFLFPEDMETSKKIDSLWEVHWYPNTPIGFYTAFGSTLEYALAKATQIQLEIEKDKA